MLESQIRYVVQAVRRLAAEGPATLDVVEVQRRYNDWVQQRIHAPVGTAADQRTGRRRNMTNWPDFTFAYRAAPAVRPAVYVLAPTRLAATPRCASR